MRRLMPKASAWRVMQFDTLRLRLIKIAARVVELKIHLPSNTPRSDDLRHHAQPAAAPGHLKNRGMVAPPPTPVLNL